MSFNWANLHFPDRRITREDVAGLLHLTPRRHRLADLSWKGRPWEPFSGSGTNLCLSFPFAETFARGYTELQKSLPQEDRITSQTPFIRNNGNVVPYSYLKEYTAEQLAHIQAWLPVIGSKIAIRDMLNVSFALDYTCENGDPDSGRTDIANLRARAKLYGNDDKPTLDALAAADLLIERCVEFINASHVYHRVTHIMAIPRSDPAKTYSLPQYLVDGIAKQTGLNDISGSIRTKAKRQQMKDTPAADRLKLLDGTLEIDDDPVRFKRILLVDDLYQSGTTMNYVALELIDKLAKAVYGLSCEKTCANLD